MDTERTKYRRIAAIVAFGVALFVGLWHLDVVLGVLAQAMGMLSFVVIGLCVAFILNAPMRMIETKIFAPLNRRNTRLWQRMRRPLAVVLTILLLLVVILFVIFMVIPEIGRTIAMVTEELPGFMKQLGETLGQLNIADPTLWDSLNLETIDWNAIGNAVFSLLQNGASSFFVGTVSAATSIVSAVVNFAVGFILAIYILLSKEKLASQVKRVMYAYLPERRVDRALDVGRRAHIIFSNFISGQFLESVILGVMFFIGMTIFRFPFAPMVAVLVGVTAVIPIFGAFIGCFVGAFMILVHEGLLTTLWFLLFFIALQQIEGNLIYPNVVGKSVMLPGLWVLVAVTLGGNLAGILGMLVSVPLCALLYVLLKEAVAARNVARKIHPKKLKAE